MIVEVVISIGLYCFICSIGNAFLAGAIGVKPIIFRLPKGSKYRNKKEPIYEIKDTRDWMATWPYIIRKHVLGYQQEEYPIDYLFFPYPIQFLKYKYIVEDLLELETYTKENIHTINFDIKEHYEFMMLQKRKEREIQEKVIKDRDDKLSNLNKEFNENYI